MAAISRLYVNRLRPQSTVDSCVIPSRSQVIRARPITCSLEYSLPRVGPGRLDYALCTDVLTVKGQAVVYVTFCRFEFAPRALQT